MSSCYHIAGLAQFRDISENKAIQLPRIIISLAGLSVCVVTLAASLI